MKCVFCGTTKDVEERDNGLVLCNTCYETSEKAKEANKEEEKMVENINELEQAVEENALDEQVSEIRCQLTIGVTEQGELYFNASGNSPDLLTIDGLLAYAKRRMKAVWEQRELALQNAASNAPEEEE